MKYDTVSFRIDKTRKAELDAIAHAMERDRSYVLNRAVEDFIEINNWQIERIKEGIAAADAGDFASDEEVAAAHAKWGVAEAE